MLLLSTFALARAPTTLYQYSRPQGQDNPAASTATVYAPKDEVFVATGGAKLRAEGRADAKVVWELFAGDPVEVLAVGTPSVYGEFGGGWFQVQAGARQGWLHASDLTPYAWRADLDLDGDTEVVTVAFMSDFSIRVTVVEPDMRVANVSTVDLDSVGGAYLAQRGGDVTAELLPAKVAGLPLVHVHSGVEACADFADYWVSYTAPGKAKPGMARVALTQVGLMDPPSCSTYEVAFDARRHNAVVTRTTGGCGDKKEKPEVEESRWVLVDGVYRAERPGGVVR